MIKNEESSLEGNSVTLTYKYPKMTSNDYFFWYRQYPGKPPELLISHSPSGSKGIENVSGLKINVEKNLISMSISSAAVSDSAVYYCALQPTVTGNNNKVLHNIHKRDSHTVHLQRKAQQMLSQFRRIHPVSLCSTTEQYHPFLGVHISDLTWSCNASAVVPETQTVPWSRPLKGQTTINMTTEETSVNQRKTGKLHRERPWSTWTLNQDLLTSYNSVEH
uniref:Ig-like domain-containing protein n=1 Tax=Sphaeramia orbicularis TaxID=375764 RepID=A0A672YD38_9TELE